MTRLSRSLVGLLVAILALSATLAPAAHARSGYANLEPGQKPDLSERVPVNLVFVGYEPGDVNAARFLAGLPRKYKPVIRSRMAYGATREQAALGLNYTFDYTAVYADTAYETAFFGSSRA